MRVLGPPLTDTERVAFIAAARARLGIKFRHRGRSLRSLDCAGLVLCSLVGIGRPVQDLRAYGPNPHQDGLGEAVRANLGEPIAFGWQPDVGRAGDVLLMRNKGDPRHVALLGEHEGALTLIHADADRGKVVEHSFVDPWPKNVVEIFRP